MKRVLEVSEDRKVFHSYKAAQQHLETSSTFCSEPVCSDGCDEKNGYCEVPNTCQCKMGFTGDNCTELLSLPTCKNGIAKSSDKLCVCKEGWKGDHCDIPEYCRAGCSSEHGSCKDPTECICNVGWQGENCDECVPYPGCEYGTCVDPWECKCDDGYSGTFCNETVEVVSTNSLLRDLWELDSANSLLRLDPPSFETTTPGQSLNFDGSLLRDLRELHMDN